MGRKKKAIVKGNPKIQVRILPEDDGCEFIRPINITEQGIDNLFMEYTKAVSLYQMLLEKNVTLNTPGDFERLVDLRAEVFACSNNVAEAIASLIEEKRK